MSIKLSDKVYRNTQEQVLKNAEDIEELKAGTILIPDGAVTAPKIAGNAVTTDKLALNAVSTEKIQAEAVTSAKINDGAVTTGKIADGAVTADKINDDSVTESKIVDGAVSYQKLDGDLKQEVNFGISERLKTINLFDGILENGGIDGSGQDVPAADQCRSVNYINVTPGATYYYSKNTSNYGFYIYRYNNGVYVDYIDGAGSGASMTMPSNVNQVRFRFNANASVLIQTNIMFNEGSTALPYQPYAGPILHKVDIKPVLLWKNATPSVDFTSGDITVSENPLNYKYIVVEFKTYKTNDEIKIQKFGSVVGTTSFNGTFYTSAKLWNIARNITFSNSTTISLDTGVYQEEGVTGSSNGVAIPIAIYGTNLL